MFRKPSKPQKIVIKKLLSKDTGTEFSEEFLIPSPESLYVLESRLQEFQKALNNSPDIVIRRFFIGKEAEIEAAIIYIDGLIDKNEIDEAILRPLMLETININKQADEDGINLIAKKLITAGDVNQEDRVEQIIKKVLAGNTVIIVDGFKNTLLISTQGWEKRAIKEPDTEIVIKGPRDGFVETLRTNTALLRRKLGHPDLVLESMVVGRITQTDICLAYIKGIVDDELINEVRRRISRIDTDGILAAGFIEQFIEDAPLSIFTTIGYTERPDVAAAKILEGRIAIIVDGTPVVNTVPMLFIESFQSPDDYNFRPFFSTMIRWIRYIAFMLTILSPALYVALATYHQEIIPTQLLISMAAANEGTPFPAVVEVLGMGMIFEILREAGIRLPRPIGEAVSIVGALVIGEATVTAGLVGAPTVIVVALTAISSFVTPTLAPISVIVRFVLTILAGVLGAFGIISGLLLILIHITSIRSFGVPFLSPISPLSFKDLKDVFIRAPIWMLSTRPKFIGWNNPVRQGKNLEPQPPKPNNRER